jgi:hypothetical protein
VIKVSGFEANRSMARALTAGEEEERVSQFDDWEVSEVLQVYYMAEHSESGEFEWESID